MGAFGNDNFCSACRWGKKENDCLVCKNKDGKFYGMSVKGVLLAPCMEQKKIKIEERRKS